MKTTKYKMFFNVGDWSNDGHGKYEKFLLECNYSVEDIIKAYKKSCKLTGVQFNCNEDYTKRKPVNSGYEGRIELEKYRICEKYEDSLLNSECFEILKQHGLTADMVCDWNEETTDESQTEFGLIPDAFVKLWFWFVGLSLNDFKYQIVIDNSIPTINTYGKFSHHFGYGLFN